MLKRSKFKIIKLTYSEHICVNIWRINQSGHRLHEDKESYYHEKKAINKPRENFYTAIPAIEKVRVFFKKKMLKKYY